MKRLIPLALFASLVLTGCGSDQAGPADEAKLRSTLGQKEINYDEVPVEQRAQVLALMKSNGGAAKAAELEAKWGMKK